MGCRSPAEASSSSRLLLPCDCADWSSLSSVPPPQAAKVSSIRAVNKNKVSFLIMKNHLPLLIHETFLRSRGDFTFFQHAYFLPQILPIQQGAQDRGLHAQRISQDYPGDLISAARLRRGRTVRRSLRYLCVLPSRCFILLNTQFTPWADSNMVASNRHKAKQAFASLCMFPSIRVSFDRAAFRQCHCARLSHHMDISCGGLAHRHRGVAGPVSIAGVNAESQILPVILLQTLCVSN